MAVMSRLHNALSPGKSARRRTGGGQRLGQLGWAPGSRTKRRRESRGVANFLRNAILVIGLVGVGWWMASSRSRAVDPEPAVPAAGQESGGEAVPVETVDTVVAPAVEAEDPADARESPIELEPPAGTPADADVAGTPETPPPAASPDVRAPVGADDTLTDSPLPVISAILLSEGRRLAVVDGRVLGVGQQAGAWEVVSVDRDSVVLRDPSGVERVVSLNHE